MIIGYGHTINYAFHFDDLKTFVDTQSDHIKELNWDTISPILHINRPIPNLTFALNFYFDRLETRGYHLVNIVIHFLSTVLVYFIFLQTLSLSGSGRANIFGFGNGDTWLLHREKIALIGAILWSVHPVQTQAVTYVVQRMASMAAMFFFGSLLFYVYGRLASGFRSALWFALSAIFAMLSFATKENCLTLPLVVLLYDLFFIVRFNFQVTRKQWMIFGGILLATILGFQYVVNTYIGANTFIGMLGANYGTEDMDSWLRVMTEWRVLIFYISLLILPLPSRMNLDPDFPISTGFFHPMTTFLSFLVLAAALVFAIRKARDYPLISFAILWYLINMAIESSFIKLDLVFEHRLYLPSVMFFLIVAGLFYDVAKRMKIKEEGLVLTAVFLTAAALLYTTHERNKVWRTSVSLWTDVAAKSPNKSRVQNNLGKAYLEEEQWDRARDQFIQSIKLDPKNQEALNNLGNAYQREAKYDLSIKYYQEVLNLNGNNPLAHNDIGVAYQATGKPDDAIREFKEAVMLDPNYTDARNNLGNIYLITGKLDLAKEQYLKTIDLNPKHMMAHTNLGILYQKQGKMKEALEEFKVGLSLNPHSAIAQFNYGYMMDMMGNKAEAIAHYEDVLRYAAPQDAGQVDMVKRRLKEIRGS